MFHYSSFHYTEMTKPNKIRRVRTGCWTCKKRRRKCDEAKPACENCVKTGRTCEGYGLKLSFDVDDSRNNRNGISVNTKGEMIHGFRGRPRLNESLAKRTGLGTDSINSSQTTNAKQSPPKSEIPKDKKTLISSESTPDTQLGDFIQEFHIFQDLFPSLIEQTELIPLVAMDSSQTHATTRQDNVSLPKRDSGDMSNEEDVPISDVEENMMLKHFFKKLLPLFDAHPSSPWPQLALKYCDFEVSKSCFIALSCIHLYEQKGAGNFYRHGMVHINNTMEHLIEYLKDKSGLKGYDSDSSILDVSTVVKNLKKQSLEKQRSNFFVILLLIHVHSLFTVVESGRSALVRTFFELFGAIVKDSSFSNYLGTIDESSILIANLAWFDTITAVVSPDCRLPYCEESWYGTKDSPSSTTKLMGCPGEIFTCIFRFCKVRKQLKDSSLSPNNVLDLNSLNSIFESIRLDLLKYRDYVIFSPEITEEEYQIRLQCAQCWALAVLVNLYRLLHPQAQSTIHGFINEFICTYNSMERTSPLVTQMVWPIFTIGCVCETEYQRRHFKQFIDDLYSQSRMGNVNTIDAITQECWNTGKTWEEILASKEWLESGIDFLVV